MEDSNKPSRFARFENFIDRHKVGITATVSIVATATVMNKWFNFVNVEMQDFIEYKGLMDEYIESPQYYANK